MSGAHQLLRRASGPAGGTYRRLFVPVDAGVDAERAVAEACLLASRSGVVFAIVPLEVPLDLPLDAPLPDGAEARAHDALARARAIGQTYGVDVHTRIVRTRGAGETIVEEAQRNRAEAIVVRMRRAERLDHVTEFVLRHAGCRVLVAAT